MTEKVEKNWVVVDVRNDVVKFQHDDYEMCELWAAEHNAEYYGYGPYQVFEGEQGEE